MDGDARLDELRSLLGERGLVTDAEAMPPYLEDWRGLADGKAVAIARPATTEEVAAVVRWCAETGTAAVPQGGVTGLVNASAPHGPRAVLVLSLDRMNRVLEVDPVTMTLTAEAGCILQQAQGRRGGSPSTRRTWSIRRASGTTPTSTVRVTPTTSRT